MRTLCLFVASCSLLLLPLIGPYAGQTTTKCEAGHTSVVIREQMDNKSPKLSELSCNAPILALETADGWTRVKTDSGLEGFVPESSLSESEFEDVAKSAPKAPMVTEGSSSLNLALHQADGGSVVTELGYGYAVNKGSSLHHRWFAIQDPTSPIELGNIGIKTAYQDRQYSFVATGTARTKSPVVAYELHYVLFDIWGDRTKTLSETVVSDLKTGTYLNHAGTWYSSENDVEEYFTSVAYVDKVMQADGNIWRANRKAISEKLAEVQLRVSESGLVPDPSPAPR